MAMTAELTNSALADLDFLVGDWDITLSGASFLPGPDQVLAGRVEVRLIEAGGLLAMRQMSDPAGPPLASWVIGRDASRPSYTVLYTDARGVSRVYEMTLAGGLWRIWRDNPEFSQRFEATISTDRDDITGHWEKRTSNGVWEHDFYVTYTRRAA
jgi:hypothetical protein